MLFKEYKKMYVEFCEEEIMREIVLAKRRYLRKEHKAVSQCVLNATDEYGNEKLEGLKGDEDVALDAVLKLHEKVENNNLAKSMKLLTAKEQEVVSLYFEDGATIEQINIRIGTRGARTPSRIRREAVDKMKNDMKGE